MRLAPDRARWDLSELYAGPGDPALARDMEEAARLAGNVRALTLGFAGHPDARGLAGALGQAFAALEKSGRIAAYADLYFAADAANPDAADLSRAAAALEGQIKAAAAGPGLAFAALDQDTAGTLLADPVLAAYRHYLEKERQAAPYRKSLDHEAVLAALESQTRENLASIWGHLASGLRLGRGGRPVQTAFADLLHLGPARRARTAAAIARAVARHQDVFARIMRQLIALETKVAASRGLPHSLSLAAAAEEIPDEAVAVMLGAMRPGNALMRRWCALKAAILKLPVLGDADLIAAQPGTPEISLQDALELVIQSFAAFSPDLARPAQAASAPGRIDAFPRQDKRYGAFCRMPPGSRAPYIFLNYRCGARDLLTLAHELGHAAHQVRSAPLPPQSREPVPAAAETAAFFAEILVFDRLMRRPMSGRERLCLLLSRIEDELTATVRQAAHFTFEQAMRREYAATGTLTAESLNRLFAARQQDLYGDALVLTDYTRGLWAMHAHFVIIPGYVRHYPIAFAAAQAIHRSSGTGPGAAAAFLDFLSSGSREPLTSLFAAHGVRLDDPDLYRQALAGIEDKLGQAEALHRSLHQEEKYV